MNGKLNICFQYPLVWYIQAKVQGDQLPKEFN